VNLRAFIRVDAMPNLLEAEMAGKKMKEYELLEDDKVIDDCMWLLENFLGKPLPDPINIKRTKWLTNPNFLGTYSYQSHPAGLNNILPRDLAKPISNINGKPLILFAGEATDDRFPGNSHGAITSGWRVADEIIEFYR
jgi:monoamine oxidase